MLGVSAKNLKLRRLGSSLLPCRRGTKPHKITKILSYAYGTLRVGVIRGLALQYSFTQPTITLKSTVSLYNVSV